MNGHALSVLVGTGRVEALHATRVAERVLGLVSVEGVGCQRLGTLRWRDKEREIHTKICSTQCTWINLKSFSGTMKCLFCFFLQMLQRLIKDGGEVLEGSEFILIICGCDLLLAVIDIQFFGSQHCESHRSTVTPSSVFNSNS